MDWQRVDEEQGGRYRVCSLVLKRAQQLVKGAAPIPTQGEEMTANPVVQAMNEVDRGVIGFQTRGD